MLTRTHLKGSAHDHEPLDRFLYVNEGRFDGVGEVVEPLKLLAQHRVHALVPPDRISDLCCLHVEFLRNLHFQRQTKTGLGRGLGSESKNVKSSFLLPDNAISTITFLTMPRMLFTCDRQPTYLVFRISGTWVSVCSGDAAVCECRRKIGAVRLRRICK